MISLNHILNIIWHCTTTSPSTIWLVNIVICNNNNINHDQTTGRWWLNSDPSQGFWEHYRGLMSDRLSNDDAWGSPMNLETYLYISIYLYIHTYLNIHISYIYIYIYTYIYICIYTYIFLYMHDSHHIFFARSNPQVMRSWSINMI